MRMNTMFTLAAATVVSAQNSTTLELPPKPVPTPAPGQAVNGFPGLIGNFELYGCVQSDNGFPTFERVSSLNEMTLEFCAASCETKYFGTEDTDCYCGEELDAAESKRVDLNLCDIKCPGNDQESCGGLLDVIKRDVPINILLTVYIRRDGEGDATTTITSTSTGASTTVTATVTKVYAQPTPDYQGIVCYGDVCTPNAHCPVCESHRVVCQDNNCNVETCPLAEADKLVICHGGVCEYAHGQTGKVVCYNGVCDVQECKSAACQAKIVPAAPCNGSCPTPAPPAVNPAPVCYGPVCPGNNGAGNDNGAGNNGAGNNGAGNNGAGNNGAGNNGAGNNGAGNNGAGNNGSGNTGNNGNGNAGVTKTPVTPVQAGAGSLLPAVGAVVGLVAGIAALL